MGNDSLLAFAPVSLAACGESKTPSAIDNPISPGNQAIDGSFQARCRTYR